MKVLVTQSCPTLCNPMDCSPPGSSVGGILQAGILEWVAIPISRGSPKLRDWIHGSYIAGRFFTVWATRKTPFLPHSKEPGQCPLPFHLLHLLYHPPFFSFLISTLPFYILLVFVFSLCPSHQPTLFSLLKGLGEGIEKGVHLPSTRNSQKKRRFLTHLEFLRPFSSSRHGQETISYTGPTFWPYLSLEKSLSGENWGSINENAHL